MVAYVSIEEINKKQRKICIKITIIIHIWIIRFAVQSGVIIKNEIIKMSICEKFCSIKSLSRDEKRLQFIFSFIEHIKLQKNHINFNLCF